jgi:hypothetical protein
MFHTLMQMRMRTPIRDPQLRVLAIDDAHHIEFVIAIVSIVLILQIVLRAQSLSPLFPNLLILLFLLCENVSLIGLKTLVEVQL